MEIPELNKIANQTNANLNNAIRRGNEDIALAKSMDSNLDKAVSVSLENGQNIDIPFKTDGILADMLKLAGFKVTPETMKIVQALISSGFPISKENVAMMNQALKLMDGDVNKALFFIKNDLPVLKTNAEMINGYTDKNISLSKQIESLVDEILNLDNTELKNTLISKLVGNSPDELSTQLKSLNIETTSTQKQVVENSFINRVLSELILKQPEGVMQQATEIVKTNPEAFEQILQTAETVLLLKNAVAQSKDNLTNTLGQIFDNNGNAQQLRQAIGNIVKTFAAQSNPQAPTTALVNAENVADILGTKDIIELVKQTFGENSPQLKQAKTIMSGEVIEKSTIDNTKQIKETIVKKLMIKPDESDPKTINKLLNNIKEATSSIKQELIKHVAVNTTKLQSVADDINKNLNFLNAVKNNAAYVQIPISVNNQQVNAELFVFKRDHTKKSMKGSGYSESALIALDLLNLGHMETYIQKSGSKINCQFRIETAEIENLIKSNINMLDIGLKQAKLELMSCAYKNISEPFNLTDDEPIFDESASSQSKIHTFDFKA